MAVLGSVGMGIIYGLKVNFSVAIVAMVNHTALGVDHLNSSVDSGPENHTVEAMPQMDGPFVWTSKEQGAVLGSYFFGYFLTQIPGGRMAELYSAKTVFLTATVMNVVGALVTPTAAALDYRALIAVRVVQGMGGGFTFPAMNVMMTAWSPSSERSTMSTIAFSGTSLGTVLFMLTAGLISSSLGWEAVFYLQGGLSVVWCVLWVMLVSDLPSSHRFASAGEVEYINSGKPCPVPSKEGDTPPASPSIPWRSICSSLPFLALALSHLCQNFGWYMLLIELPLFLRTGLKVGMTTNTIMSSVPFFANFIFSLLYSRTLDWARSRDYVSTRNGRKISVCVASLLPASCLIFICLAGTNVPVIVTLTVLAVMFYGSMFSGVFSNHSDLAPNFAGTLMALTNMLATVPGFVVPMLVGVLTDGQSGLGPWHIVFYMTAGILVTEAVVFSLLGKGELQRWNSPK